MKQLAQHLPSGEVFVISEHGASVALHYTQWQLPDGGIDPVWLTYEINQEDRVWVSQQRWSIIADENDQYWLNTSL